jgi:hypothetical protein
MPTNSNDSQQPRSCELSESLAADTVRVALRIVRNQLSPESVANAQTAWLVQKVLASLAEKEDKHDTLLRFSEARFATWAGRVRAGLRRQGRSEKR